MEHLIRETSNDAFEGSIELGPAFFKYHHPYLGISSWPSKENFAVLVDWEIVINDNFLILSSKQDSCHVDPALADLEGREEVLDPESLLC